MFERFTAQARRVVVAAQEESRTLRHREIGVEHLLLGLLCEQDGLGAQALAGAGITAEHVRAELVRVEGTGAQAVSGQVPVTPDAKQALERALREAIFLGHRHIDTEHLLLGLLHERDAIPARIRSVSDADVERIRSALDLLMASAGPGTARPTGAAAPSVRSSATTPRRALDARTLSDAQLEDELDVLLAEERRLIYEQGVLQGRLEMLSAQRERLRGRAPGDAG